MSKRIILLSLFIVAALFSYAAAADFTQDQIVSIATEEIKAKGFEIKDVNIVYDVDGKLWSERLGTVGFEDENSNKGILKKGFLKNYKIVYFDYVKPLKDVWVFVDKDTGDVLTVYQE